MRENIPIWAQVSKLSIFFMKLKELGGFYNSGASQMYARFGHLFRGWGGVLGFPKSQNRTKFGAITEKLLQKLEKRKTAQEIE